MKEYKYSELGAILILVGMLNRKTTEPDLLEASGGNTELIKEAVRWYEFFEEEGIYPYVKKLLREDGSPGLVYDEEFQDLCILEEVSLSGLDGRFAQHAATVLWIKRNCKDAKQNPDGSISGTITTTVNAPHYIWRSGT